MLRRQAPTPSGTRHHKEDGARTRVRPGPDMRLCIRAPPYNLSVLPLPIPRRSNRSLFGTYASYVSAVEVLCQRESREKAFPPQLLWRIITIERTSFGCFSGSQVPFTNVMPYRRTRKKALGRTLVGCRKTATDAAGWHERLMPVRSGEALRERRC